MVEIHVQNTVTTDVPHLSMNHASLTVIYDPGLQWQERHFKGVESLNSRVDTYMIIVHVCNTLHRISRFLKGFCQV